ncbi:hypothetical protein HZ326_23462 [Fusarium oxysporum f. sp. albedinis]|nr:hypothetical protein HZ326_23462 [Fusarium oxysporum f. sp. albedinis]
MDDAGLQLEIALNFDFSPVLSWAGLVCFALYIHTAVATASVRYLHWRYQDLDSQEPAEPPFLCQHRLPHNRPDRCPSSSQSVSTALGLVIGIFKKAPAETTRTSCAVVTVS